MAFLLRNGGRIKSRERPLFEMIGSLLLLVPCLSAVRLVGFQNFLIGIHQKWLSAYCKVERKSYLEKTGQQNRRYAPRRGSISPVLLSVSRFPVCMSFLINARPIGGAADHEWTSARSRVEDSSLYAAVNRTDIGRGYGGPQGFACTCHITATAGRSWFSGPIKKVLQ